jgi:hypothetical protein
MKRNLPIFALGAVIATVIGVPGYWLTERAGDEPQNKTVAQSASESKAPNFALPAGGSDTTAAGEGGREATVFSPLALSARSSRPTRGKGEELRGVQYLSEAKEEGEEEEAESRDGAAMMGLAVATMDQHLSVTARIRQTVRLFEQELVGSGTYLQQGQGDQKLLKMELRMQVGEQVASLQQISDGQFLWVRRELPGEQGDQLGRVHLRRIREAMHDKPQVATTDVMALGGVSRLLSALRTSFEFEKPELTQIDDTPVWMVDGRWNKKMLARLLPNQKEAILAGESPQLNDLPAHVPDSVRIMLGRDDLFPYRVEFARRPDGANGYQSGWVIVRMEMFEVAFGTAIDPLQFTYKPDERAVRDLTDQYLIKLGLEKPTPK